MITKMITKTKTKFSCVHLLTRNNRTRWLMQQDGRKKHVHYCQKCEVLRLGKVYKEEK